jgi:hypothetical protein
MNYDPFAIGVSASSIEGIPLPTHSMGIPISIGDPPSIMDPLPPPPFHAPTHAVAQAYRALPWWRRWLVRVCWKFSAVCKAIAEAEPPTV